MTDARVSNVRLDTVTDAGSSNAKLGRVGADTSYAVEPPTGKLGRVGADVLYLGTPTAMIHGVHLEVLRSVRDRKQPVISIDMNPLPTP